MGDDHVYDAGYGLNKREWFASQFLQTLTQVRSSNDADGMTDQDMAKKAVEMADHLIEAINAGR